MKKALIGSIAFAAIAFLLVFGAYQSDAADVNSVSRVGFGHTVTLEYKDLGDHHALASYPDDYEWLRVFNAATVSAGIDLIAIDLDGTTTYRHTATDAIIFKDIDITACLSGDTGEYIIELGIVTENDATDGTVNWFWRWAIGEKGCYSYPKPVSEINGVLDGGTLTYIGTGVTTNSNAWDNDDLKATFFGTLTPPEPGDLVTRVVERTNGSSLSFGVSIVYRTE